MFRVYHASLELLTPKQGVTLRFVIIPLMRYIACQKLSELIPARTEQPSYKTDLKRVFKKTSSIINYQPLLKSRLAKIIELQKLRNFNCEGNRELMSFVFYNTAVQVYPHEVAQQKTELL